MGHRSVHPLPLLLPGSRPLSLGKGIPPGNTPPNRIGRIGTPTIATHKGLLTGGHRARTSAPSRPRLARKSLSSPRRYHPSSKLFRRDRCRRCSIHLLLWLRPLSSQTQPLLRHPGPRTGISTRSHRLLGNFLHAAARGARGVEKRRILSALRGFARPRRPRERRRSHSAGRPTGAHSGGLRQARSSHSVLPLGFPAGHPPAFRPCGLPLLSACPFGPLRPFCWRADGPAVARFLSVCTFALASFIFGSSLAAVAGA